MLNEIEKGHLASHAVQCFTRATGSLSDFPVLLKRVIQERAWERRSDHGIIFELPNLRELIIRKPIEGWGQDPQKIEAVIRDDPEVLVMFREEMKGDEGGDKRSKTTCYIITGDAAKTGTSRGYSIARVQKECDPETVALVMSKQMSPHAALVKAGIRKNRQIYIPTDPAKVIPKLKQAFGEEFVQAMLSASGI